MKYSQWIFIFIDSAINGKKISMTVWKRDMDHMYVFVFQTIVDVFFFEYTQTCARMCAQITRKGDALNKIEKKTFCLNDPHLKYQNQ